MNEKGEKEKKKEKVKSVKRNGGGGGVFFISVHEKICSYGDSELQLIESLPENMTWSGTEADTDYSELQLGSGRKKLTRNPGAGLLDQFLGRALFTNSNALYWQSTDVMIMWMACNAAASLYTSVA
ncbi:hypothetical protein Peur_010910 [Populus x canadensis]